MFEIPYLPRHIAACFNLFINFNRYSSLVPIMEFRTNYEMDYLDFFYGKIHSFSILSKLLLLIGKPDKLRLLSKSDFLFNGTLAKNIRLKWMAICLNFNYEEGKVDLFLNGEKMPQIVKKPISLPDSSDNERLIVRMGRYYYDGTPLIGKIVDINIWDR